MEATTVQTSTAEMIESQQERYSHVHVTSEQQRIDDTDPADSVMHLYQPDTMDLLTPRYQSHIT